MNIPRLLLQQLKVTIEKGRSILLLGARQTGKSTLCAQLDPDLTLSLLHPTIRQRYEREPSLLINEIEALSEQLLRKPLVFIDEIQKIPSLLDSLQYLIDREVAQFIITGSSARKLRKPKVNWLPGRVILFHLDPLMTEELQELTPSLETLLSFGSLPRIILTSDDNDKVQELAAYVATYVEDEIRTEAAVRNVSNFVRFLPLAASQSGKLINFNHLSQEIGVAHTTINNYYQILEDCLIAYRIEPLTKSTKRKRLTRTPKYLFFDIGVRRFCANETAKEIPTEYKGQLFEEFVGLELLRHLHLRNEGELQFWRDNNGPEVDWVVNFQEKLIPVEVKWTDKPSLKDSKHLQVFLTEYTQAEKAYIVCRTPKKMKLAENIYALPWQDIEEIIEG